MDNADTTTYQNEKKDQSKAQSVGGTKGWYALAVHTVVLF